MDWKDYGVDGNFNKTIGNKKLGSGSIILLHNRDATINAKKHSVNGGILFDW